MFGYPHFDQSISGRYTAVHDSGDRFIASIKNVVIHSTEGETAEGAAAWFADPRSEGSAHLVLSDDIAFMTLAETRIPWAAPPWNTRGYHIEVAGFAAWTHDEWMRHEKRVWNAAAKTAFRCHRYDIPPRWLEVPQVKLNMPGITSHANISAAFHDSTHTDPGVGFPVGKFMDAVHWYFKQI